MNPTIKWHLTAPFYTLILLLLSHHVGAQKTKSFKEVSQSFYITANTGMAETNRVLQEIARASQKDQNATLLLVGNVTPEKGFENSEESREFLRKTLLDPIKNFNGRVVATPGINEWNKGAPQSINDLESFLQENANLEFWPDDGCPLENEEIGDHVVLISVDSQWYLQDWDDQKEMNTNCELDTREKFFTEFKGDLGDSQGKTVIVAVHHPVFTNTLSPVFNKITGIIPQSVSHKKHKELMGRLETLASLHDDVIFVSGSDRNLQFLKNDRNPQIISGAAGETENARVKRHGKFASEEQGYAKLTVYKDGSSNVEFFSVENESQKLLFSEVIPLERKALDEIHLRETKTFKNAESASIYTSEETDKSRFYTLLWGERYRDLYGRSIEAPVLILDSLEGNVKPISEGGGHQSRSLRLINDSKNEYTLRALRKDPLQYIQADLMKTNYIQNFLDSTVIKRYISDYFTTSHPYAPFAVNELSEAADILHANPKIYYVPKQKGLGIYSEEYGDALFMLEEHVGDENKEFETFGSPDNILSTADLLIEMRKTKDAYVDQQSYIKARLFDMLIGDWDRHSDQWRWAEFDENGRKRFEAIPRDRDHAFSKYDGWLQGLLRAIVPLLRKMQPYDKDLENVKWFNWSPYPLDERLITTNDWSIWEEQVNYLKEKLTDQEIDEAFATLPEEIQDRDLEVLKEILRGRRENLLKIARDYYEYLQKHHIVTGTNEDETFKITRKDNGITEVVILREGKETFRSEFSSEKTKEIWIYGLEGKDSFDLAGKGNGLIKLKIMGGYEDDVYNFENTRKAKLYDFKNEENIITNSNTRKWLVDSYDINTYKFEKRKYNVNKIMPMANFETDAGFTLGLRDTYTTYGLVRNPFTSQYEIGAGYYFASNGFKIMGSAEYAHVFYNWNFKIEGLYSGPNYSMNYFGWGNETSYDKTEVDKSYNRVMIEESKIAPALVWRNDTNTTSFSWNVSVESNEVKAEENSFIEDNFSSGNDIFDDQLYAGTEATFNYLNKNNKSFPSLGTEFNVTAGYKKNIDENNNRFGYLRPYISIDYPVIPSGFAVIATKIGGEVIIGDNYEFYHAATLGGNRSLRGYRNHRFTGEKSFYQSIDVRSAVGLIRTKFIPLIVGVTAGFDYGRIWADGEDSNQWHHDYGGSVWINGLYALTLNAGYYHGGDGNRLSLMLNFKF